MFTFSTYAETITELKEKIEQGLKDFNVSGAAGEAVAPQPGATPPAPTAPEAPTPTTEAKNKPGRKPKAAAGSGIAPQPGSQAQGAGTPFESASRPDASPAAAPALKASDPEVSKLTLEDVRAALSVVLDKFGLDGREKAFKIIQPFGYSRVKDIKPEHFQQVIEAAKAAVA